MKELLLWAYSVLEKAGVDSPRLSAELIISHVLNTSRLNLFTSPETKLTETQLNKAFSYIKRRSIGEPVAYIIGKKEFYGREFSVTKDVLIPRPETETLIDLLKSIVSKDTRFLFLDIGTGSGNIAVTLACEYPNAIGVACDISQKALLVAKKNALKFRVENKVLFVCTDLTKGIRKNFFDIVLSNPPYIGYKSFMFLQRDIRCFEPYRSLVGGYHGWEFYLKLFDFTFCSLKKEGIFLIEIDEQVKKNVEKILRTQNRCKDLKFFKDLSGKYRVVYGRKT